MATAKKTTGRKLPTPVTAPTDEPITTSVVEAPQEPVGNIEVQQEEKVSVDAGSSIASTPDEPVAAVVVEAPQESVGNAEEPQAESAGGNTSDAKNQFRQYIETVIGEGSGVISKANETKRAGEATGQDDAPEVTSVRVKSVSPKGFRRCGRVWPPEFAEVSVDSLPDGAVDILIKDPDLVVELVSGPAVSRK